MSPSPLIIPQMSPMNWLMLFSLFNSSFAAILVKTHFSNV